MKKSLVWVGMGLLLAIVMVAMVACGGDTGPAGPAGPAGGTGGAGVAAFDAEPESCVVCHKGAGDEHQASYDELYQDGVITISNVAYKFTAPSTHIVTFKMAKDGEPFDANDADSVGIYFTQYTGTSFEGTARQSIKGTLTYDGAGGVTSTLVESGADYARDLGNVDGLIVVYGRDETTFRVPGTRVYQNKYPFAALYETGAGVDYVSAANNAGCEKCHTVPYLKHSYIYGQVNGDAATDFYTCKACHLDNGSGGHEDWQILVDDPARYADLENNPMTAAEKAKYAYKISLMNDVHMSHNMEFPYPQSMSNCVTCHEGKLDMILTDASFTVETCKSCHAVTGAMKLDPADEDGEDTIFDTTGLALENIITHAWTDATDCTACHGAGGIAPVFSAIHTGYDEVIYDAAGTKYSEVITVTIDSVSLGGDDLTIKFSAAESQDLAGLDVADIVPTVMVGLYGYDTKDYIVGPHRRSFDDNGDGEISRSSGDQRDLEAEVGAEHPRLTTVSAGGGSWEVTADLSAWADIIADGIAKRAEIGVMAVLENADGVEIALNAVSRTFDLVANAFDDDFYSPIVRVATGCNNCHDALGTTFHGPDRGGSIVVCRMCHITLDDGSHLEMQSRSIDSYVHAIHSFQAFDIGDIDFAEPVEATEYEHHTELFPYPTHGITNCESCHNEGTYNVPDETKSLLGRLSKADAVTTMDRAIGAVPSYVTGPASRACGACHRATLIKEDDAVGLAAFNQHMRAGGYLIAVEEDEAEEVLAREIASHMAIFE